MQLLPETWDWVDVVLLGQRTPRTADGNVRAGVRYLRWQLDQFHGDVKLALAGWYQGARAVREIGLYDDTKQFVVDRADAPRQGLIRTRRSSSAMASGARAGALALDRARIRSGRPTRAARTVGSRTSASFYCEVDGEIVAGRPDRAGGAGERERFWRALDRDVERLGPPHVVLTCAWHAEARATCRSATRAVGSGCTPRCGRAAGAVVATTRFGPAISGRRCVGDRRASSTERSSALAPVARRARRAVTCCSADGPAGFGSVPTPGSTAPTPRPSGPTLRALPRRLPVERVLVTHGEPVLTNGRDALDARSR